MKRFKLIPLLIIFLLIMGGDITAQPEPPISISQVTGSLIVDCHAYKNGLAVLAKDGHVWQVSTADYAAVRIPNPYSGIVAIGADRNNMLWAVDSFATVYLLQDTGWKYELYLSAPETWAICFDKSNSLFLLTNLGIYNNKTEKYYGTNR